jgi:hypothetical protein
MGINLLDPSANDADGMMGPEGRILLKGDAAYFANATREAFVQVQSLTTGQIQSLPASDIGNWLRKRRISEAIQETDFLRTGPDAVRAKD